MQKHRSMQKAKREAAFQAVLVSLIAIGCVVTMNWLPDNPLEQKHYMTPNEILIAGLVALLFLICIFAYGTIAGRFYEAYESHWGRSYLGKPKEDPDDET